MLEVAESPLIEGAETFVGSPLFANAATVVVGAALLIGGFRFLYRKAVGG